MEKSPLKEQLLPNEEQQYNQETFIKKQLDIRKRYDFNRYITIVIYIINMALSIPLYFFSLSMTIEHKKDMCYDTNFLISAVLLLCSTLSTGAAMYFSKAFHLPEAHRYIDPGHYTCQMRRNVNNEIENEEVVTTLADGTIIYQSFDKISYFYMDRVCENFHIEGKGVMSYNDIFPDDTYTLQCDESYKYRLFKRVTLDHIPTVDELNAPFILDEKTHDKRFRWFMIFRTMTIGFMILTLVSIATNVIHTHVFHCAFITF